MANQGSDITKPYEKKYFGTKLDGQNKKLLCFMRALSQAVLTPGFTKLQK